MNENLPTETPNKWIPSPEVRKYIYGILSVLAPVGVFYGILSAEEVALWLGVAATVLAAGANALAAVNTPKDEKEGELS